MDLIKNGKLIADLRKAKGLTQKQVAKELGICAKTVSKWETGHGLPDVSYIAELGEILGVSTETIVSGKFKQNSEENGNLKKTKIYVCKSCGGMTQGTGDFKVFCCGKQLKPLKAAVQDEKHKASVSLSDDEFYIEFSHEMTKEHFIGFIVYITYDKVLVQRLYPEQSSAVRIPRIYGGRLYFYCNKHGLFEVGAEKFTARTRRERNL